MFSLDLLNSVTKIFLITVKGFKPAISCVGDQDATTAPARFMPQMGSLHGHLFMLQWFIKFPEFTEFPDFLFHFGKTPLFLLLLLPFLRDMPFSLTIFRWRGQLFLSWDFIVRNERNIAKLSTKLFSKWLITLFYFIEGPWSKIKIWGDWYLRNTKTPKFSFLGIPALQNWQCSNVTTAFGTCDVREMLYFLSSTKCCQFLLQTKSHYICKNIDIVRKQKGFTAWNKKLQRCLRSMIDHCIYIGN